ncbi:MAG: hypothetical protein ACW964_02495 [Candidatus Hodarchaeales archaeon]
MPTLKETTSRIRDPDYKTKKLLNQYILADFTRLVAFSISSIIIIKYSLDPLESALVDVAFTPSFLFLSLTDYLIGNHPEIIGFCFFS